MTLSPAAYPGTHALLAARPDLLGVGISDALDLARWAA